VKLIQHVFSKELREMFRDKRVITGAFLGPVILIIFLLTLFGFLDKAVKEPSIGKIGVVQGGEKSPLIQALSLGLKAEVDVVPTLQEGRQRLRQSQVKILFHVVPRKIEGAAQEGQEMTAYFDRNEQVALIAAQAAQAAVQKQNSVMVQQSLQGAGLSPDLSEPVMFRIENESASRGLGASTIVSLLPYLIIIWAFYGGFSIVSDLVAGEKERGTLETLLISPIRRIEIVWGKFIALSIVCLLSSLSSLVGVLIVGILPIGLAKTLFPDGIQMGIGPILAITATLVPLVAFFSGLLLAISAFAKNMRECQTYLTLVSFLVLIPAIFSQFIGFTDLGKATWVQFAPILNSSVVIRDALLNKLNGQALLICMAVNILLALVMLRIVVRMFHREEILVRT